MLDVSPPILSVDQASRPRVALLARGVILLSLDVPHIVRASAPLSIVDRESATPGASLRLSLTDGGTRLLWVLRRPHDGSFDISLASPLGQNVNVSVEPDAQLGWIDGRELLRGIDGGGRVALVSALFNVWSPLFKLHRSQAFVKFLRSVLMDLAPEPIGATAIATAGADYILLRTSLTPDFSKIDAIYALSGEGPSRLGSRPHRSGSSPDGRDALHFFARRTLVKSPFAMIVMIGPGGMSVRSISTPDSRLPSLADWLSGEAKSAHGLREHLLIDLSQLSETGKLVSIDTQLRSPLQPKRIAGRAISPSAEIVCALSTSAGTLVTGWYDDPSGIVASLSIDGPDGAIDLNGTQHRFSVDVSNPRGGDTMKATGMVALAPASRRGGAALLQPRFRLGLKSGGHYALVPPPQPADPVQARAVALRAVPPEHVSEVLLANVLAPVIADLHAKVGASIGAPSSRWIGVPIERPKVSVVIPLYRVLDFLRFQIGAFATDPWFRTQAELIFVLDSPNQAAEVEHLLGGLNLVYGLPMLLVVMDRNGGYARACNVGATFARANALAFINSDVIPLDTGWLDRLVGRLGGKRRIGAVGPKLLFEDGSIQHAGMYFGRDHRGRWLNQHFFKGMPRRYAPAMQERIVPAVTGACLVMPRALFECVGGFSQDYVIGDYEDSDLCLKITKADRAISYVPDVELYHLERRSMSVNADYMRGIAWQYNCALHAERWGDLISAIADADTLTRKSRSVAQ